MGMAPKIFSKSLEHKNPPQCYCFFYSSGKEKSASGSSKKVLETVSLEKITLKIKKVLQMSEKLAYNGK